MNSDRSLIRTFVFYDCPIMCEGVRKILDEVEGIDLVSSECNDNPDSWEVGRIDCDLALFITVKSGKDALNFLSLFKEKNPDIPSLILSTQKEEDFALRFFKRGADGYLSSSSSAQDMVLAIHKVAGGKKHLNSHVAQKLALSFLETDQVPKHHKLSIKEYEVLCRIASGKTMRHIAEDMSLSTKTISTYKFRILKKMHMKTNAELTYYAIKNGLVD